MTTIGIVLCFSLILFTVVKIAIKAGKEEAVKDYLKDKEKEYEKEKQRECEIINNVDSMSDDDVNRRLQDLSNK